MTVLLWMLGWLPQVLPALSELPRPVNPKLTSHNFIHMLRWEPGAGTPPGASYRVTVSSDTMTSWAPVPGCERIHPPLLCNLTQAFSNPKQIYLTRVTAVLDARASPPAIVRRFEPIRDTDLDPPLLSVTPCGRNVCVELQPPVETLREVYESLSYQLRILTPNSLERVQDTMFLRREILDHLAPGRQYCVSVRFSDTVVPRTSNFSEPTCAFSAGNYDTDTDALVSTLLCLLVSGAVVTLALLVASGYICVRKRPLPNVLTSIRHSEETLVLRPQRPSVCSVVICAPTPPSSGQKENGQTSGGSTTAGRKGGKYIPHTRVNLPPASSPSLSRPSAPLAPGPDPTPRSSSNPTSDSVSIRPPPAETSADGEWDSDLVPVSNRRASDPPSVSLSGGGTEPKVEEEAGRGDVNLLTLTVSKCEEEEEEEEEEDKLLEEFSASEDAAFIPPSRAETGDDGLEMLNDEEEEDSGYMTRPCKHVLQNI